MMQRLICLAVVTGACLASGCTKVPPPVVELSGVITLDGQPLPFVLVEFVPILANFGAEMNSTGITDEKGRFTLTCAQKSQPGAAVGKHHVLITEAPTPGEFRRPDQQTQDRYAQHLAKLKNRPIPAEYGVLAKTITIEVKADQSNYEIALKRIP